MNVLGFPTARRTLREMALARGAWIVKRTPLEGVSKLIEELRPVTPIKELRRLGPPADGGYLLPDDLEGIQACISPGTSTEVGFDVEVASMGMDVYQADASVDAPPVRHERFHFTNKHLDSFTSNSTITLDALCAPCADGDLLLQMDIEGAEYRVIASASDALMKRFRIMVIEFHDLDHIFSPVSFREFSSVFHKILLTHAVVHLHPNNYFPSVRVGEIEIPPLMEMTFYRRDRIDAACPPSTFPHPQDAANVPSRPNLDLPRCWWQA
jgi:hypothetical protein